VVELEWVDGYETRSGAVASLDDRLGEALQELRQA